MKKIILTYALLFALIGLRAQTPEVTSWVLNTTGATGYAGISSNVQIVQYSTNNVYISCTCIPGYSIGPWTGNPNTPTNQNFVYKITRNPQQNMGTGTAIGLGHIGVWSNGVSIFNAEDAQSYNNQGVWKRNAYYFEGGGFDNCLGHPQQQGEYHHHVSPTCLYNDRDSSQHSPIIGYAFDGFPVYGAYAYANTNGTGPIKKMESSYCTRNITTRTTLPDGSTATYAGPVVSATYPLGCFIQDFEYVPGLGDLDERNGRFCITPEYPSGTYAYFVTIDSAYAPVFPYTMIGTYYGTVQQGNTGMNSGHNTISETTTIYNPSTSGIAQSNASIKFELSPNPVEDYAYIYFDPSSKNNITGELYDSHGKLLEHIENMQPSISYTLDLSKYKKGIYFLHLNAGSESVSSKIVKTK
ncbi:MAG: YHYH protein [Bacteroidia bacterium]